MTTSEQHTATYLVNWFILRPVSSDHTDFIREFNKIMKGN